MVKGLILNRGRVSHHKQRRVAARKGAQGESWSLQDIALLQGFCERDLIIRVLPPHMQCPHYYNTIARLLQNVPPPPPPPLFFLF